MTRTRWAMGLVLLVALACGWVWLRGGAAPGEASSAPAVVEPAAPRVTAVEAPRATPTGEPAAVPDARRGDVAVKPPAQPPTLDAGQVAPNEVTFTVLHDDAPAVGERLILEAREASVSGLVDVVGSVKLSLAPGEWFVRAPRDVSPARVVVAPGVTAVTLRIAPREALSGCVTDEAGAPVAARVNVSGLTEEVIETDDGGCFSREVRGTKVRLQANTADGRSPARRVQLPAAGVSLVVVRGRPLTIRYAPAELECANVTLTSETGTQLGRCHDGAPCVVSAPAQNFSVDAVALREGAVLFGTKRVTTPPSSGELLVTLADAPPVTGVVRDLSGAPLTGVSLQFRSLYGPEFSLSDAVSGNDGTFSVTPRANPGECSWVVPTWLVSAAPPWKVRSGKLAQLGAAPLVISVERAPP